MYALVLRNSPDCRRHILALANVTGQGVSIDIGLKDVDVSWKNWYDLPGKRGWRVKDGTLSVTLAPYDVVRLIPFAELEQMIES